MDEKYMKIALKMAELAYIDGDVPVGAIIIKDNKIIAKAYNKREKTKNITDHAELIAIKKACKKIGDWRLNGCTMYVTLEPCAMCKGAISQSRIDKVIYGTANIRESENKLVNITGGILEQECSKILKNFFQNRRN